MGLRLALVFLFLFAPLLGQAEEAPPNREPVGFYRIRAGDQLMFISYWFYGSTKRVDWLLEDNPTITDKDRIFPNRLIALREIPEPARLASRDRLVMRWREKLGLRVRAIEPHRVVRAQKPDEIPRAVAEATPTAPTAGASAPAVVAAQSSATPAAPAPTPTPEEIPNWREQYGDDENAALNDGFALAASLAKRGDNASAHRVYASLADSYPQNYLVDYSAARFYQESGDAAMAEKHFLSAKQKNPKHFPTQLGLLILYRKSGDNEKALSLSAHIKKEFPKLSKAGSVAQWLLPQSSTR